MSLIGVDQDHQIVSEPCIFDVGVLAIARDLPRPGVRCGSNAVATRRRFGVIPRVKPEGRLRRRNESCRCRKSLPATSAGAALYRKRMPKIRSSSASRVSAVVAGNCSPNAATVATRYIVPVPARLSRASGRPARTIGSRCSIGRCGRNVGPTLAHSGAPYCPSTKPSSSSPQRTSSGLFNSGAPAPKMRKVELSNGEITRLGERPSCQKPSA